MLRSDVPITPIWLGNLPHDPSLLQRAEKAIAASIVRISEELGEPIAAEVLRFRFHTKGLSSNGVGLGFGFAWVPELVAKHLIQVGRLHYDDSFAGFASVRESRGNPSPPLTSTANEEIAAAIASTCAHTDLEGHLVSILSEWQTIFDQAAVHLSFCVSEKQGVLEVCRLLQGKRRLLRRLPLGVVLWRPQDLCHPGTNPTKQISALVNAAKSACSAGHKLIFLQIDPTEADEEKQVSQVLIDGLKDIDFCEVIQWKALVDLYPCAISDPLAAACAMILRHATTPLFSRLKVFVTDCDHTLWDGVVSEDGVEGVKFSTPHVELQKKLAALERAGRLICLASRNTSEQEVLQVFEDRSGECPLQLKQIVAHEVHPGSKAESLQRLSKSLSLGLDSFVFLDDNCFEIEDVSRSLPDVLTVHIPADHVKFELLLRHCWVLDAHSKTLTKEDQQRTELYRQNAARRVERGRHGNLRDFLNSLQVEIIISDISGTSSSSHVPRLSQLCLRTNQFNTTQLRLSESEVEAWCQNDIKHLLAAQVKDKFGDYGLVAGVFCSQDPEQAAIVIDCLAMSCRVLHRGVEHELLGEVAELALAQHKTQVIVKFRPSNKNDLARGFLARLYSWFEANVWHQHDVSGHMRWECGEQIFSFPALELSQLSSASLGGFSTEILSDWKKDAIDREMQVSSWTNVVDAEDWMGAPSQSKSLSSLSKLLQKVCSMGADIPRIENRSSNLAACSLESIADLLCLVPTLLVSNKLKFRTWWIVYGRLMLS